MTKPTYQNPDGSIEFTDPEALRAKLGEEKYEVMDRLRRKTNAAILRPAEPEPEE